MKINHLYKTMLKLWFIYDRVKLLFMNYIMTTILLAEFDKYLIRVVN